MEINPNKLQYTQWCSECSAMPIFLQSWWMDAVCLPENWDVLLFVKNNKIIASLVYYLKIKNGFKFIIQPPLTPLNGIWIEYSPQLTDNGKIHLEKEVINSFIVQLEQMKLAYYDQNYSSYFKNWLPFYWNNYQQTTRYTYEITDITDANRCFEQFSYAKQKQIKKAEKNLIQTDFDLTGEEFYNYLENNFKTIGEKALYTKSLFLRLYDACKLQKQCFIVSGSGIDKKLHAALFIVFDKQKAYNLISTITPEYRSSGASSLVVWEAIKYSSEKVKAFDFEGSMDMNTENSFSQFGTIQVSYFRIKKYNSKIFKAITKLRKWK